MTLAGRLMLVLRLAARELRGGLRGQGVFLACLVLGVGSVAAVGSLADQILRLLQSRAELSRDADKNEQALSEQGPDLVAGLRDARSWQAVTLSQVKQQGSGVERIFRRLGKLAEASPAADDQALEILTEDQKKAFEEMKGEKFEMPENAEFVSFIRPPSPGQLAGEKVPDVTTPICSSPSISRQPGRGTRLVSTSSPTSVLPTPFST